MPAFIVAGLLAVGAAFLSVFINKASSQLSPSAA
jgi:hypothetical protein